MNVLSPLLDDVTYHLPKEVDGVLDATQQQGFDVFGEITDDAARGARNLLSFR